MARKKFKNPKAHRSGPIPNPSILQQKESVWFERVSKLVNSRKPETKYSSSISYGPIPEDFDDDISDLEPENHPVCHCSSDASDCECDLDERDLSDDDFEFAEYKKMREDRKKALAEFRENQKFAIEYHKAREDEVEKAWTEFEERRKQGVEGQQLNLDETGFNIYSSEYVRSRNIADGDATAYIEFFWPDELGDRTDNTQLVGHIYFNADNSPDLEVFEAPKHGGLPSINVSVRENDANVTIEFMDQFFLKLIVPKSIAYSKSPQPNTPELLEFVGISRKFENDRTRQEKRKREEEAEESQKRREISQRESYFEMNHPMGWWAQSRGY